MVSENPFLKQSQRSCFLPRKFWLRYVLVYDHFDLCIWYNLRFGFWCLFFKPTCSLGSAGKQDILREGTWSREEDSAAAVAGRPRPLLQGGRSRRQAPSWLRQGGQPLSPASRPEERSPLRSASSEARAEGPTRLQQLRHRTLWAGPESLSHEEHWPGSDARDGNVASGAAPWGCSSRRPGWRGPRPCSCPERDQWYISHTPPPSLRENKIK